MNLSTSNSKYKLYVVCLLACLLICYILLNVLAYKYDHYHQAMLEQRNIYSDGVQPKYHQLKKMYATSHPDIIFIGSSTTKMHVSTSIFHHAGIEIYNYGLQGRFVSQYPSMVRNAIKLKPKIIVISMDKPQLFHPVLSNLVSPHIFATELDSAPYNVRFFLKKIDDLDTLKIASHLMVAYFINWNYFVIHGYSLTAALNEIYNDGTIHVDNRILTMDLNCDFQPTDTLKTYKECYNGDGVMFDHSSMLDFAFYGKKFNYPDNALNHNTVAVVNELLDMIRAAGIKPILVFIPQISRHIVNDSLLHHTMHAEIIDLSDYILPKNAWYDLQHYNVKGRHLYSKLLLNKIKANERQYLA